MKRFFLEKKEIIWSWQKQTPWYLWIETKGNTTFCDIYSHIGPSFISSGSWSMMCLNMGSKKAIVLPLPVLAIPIKSRPDMTAGMACAWMGVGFSYLFLGKIIIIIVKVIQKTFYDTGRNWGMSNFNHTRLWNKTALWKMCAQGIIKLCQNWIILSHFRNGCDIMPGKLKCACGIILKFAVKKVHENT